MTTDRFPFIVEIAPGCYSGPDAPVRSRHATWEAALNAASKSDRLVAVAVARGDDRRAQIPAQGDRRLGHGRFGNGLEGRKRAEWVRENA